MAPDLPVLPLIFDRLEIGWLEIYGCWGDADYDFKPTWTGPPALTGFPTPGQLEVPSRLAIKADVDGLVFPHFGAWYLRCRYGAFKFLLLDPKAGRDGHILSICSFAAANCVHSLADAWLMMSGAKARRTIVMNRIVAKLFFSDQPLHLMCGDIVIVLAYLLHRQGFLSHRVWAARNDKKTGHLVSDVFLPDREKWAMVDPDFGFMITAGGEYLSAAEVRERISADAGDLGFRNIANKGWLNLPHIGHHGSIGQVTWTPQHALPAPTASDERYRSIIADVFVHLSRYQYNFPQEATAIYKLIDSP